MPRVVIRHLENAPVAAFPRMNGVRVDEASASRAIIGPGNRPLLLWKHDLGPGSGVDFDGPVHDHALYVLNGNVESGVGSTDSGGFIVVEHGASASVKAGPQGANLLHYHRPEIHPEKPTRQGKCVHAVDRLGILRTRQEDYGHNGILLADADCPTCEVWMHKSTFEIPSSNASRLHQHTADEIIFILEGEMLVNKRRLGPGTALAIDQGTFYQFGVAEGGLTYLNFRPRDSFIVQAGNEHQPIHEVDLWRASVSPPAS